MKNFILALLLVPALTWGQNLDLRGLSQEQIAELQLQAAKMKSPENVSATVRQEATAWAELGANIGTAMVSAARELGVAANEFSQTSLGKVVTLIIVYKVIGKDILGVAVGSFILLFGFGVVLWLLMTKRFGEAKYEYRPMFWGLWQRRVVSMYRPTEESVVSRVLFSVAIFAISMIVGLNCIF